MNIDVGLDLKINNSTQVLQPEINYGAEYITEPQIQNIEGFSPTHPQVQKQLLAAEILLQDQDYALAEGLLANLIRHFPYETAVYEKLIQLHKNKSGYTDDVKFKNLSVLLDQWVDLDNHYESLRDKAHFHFSLGQDDKALSYYHRAVLAVEVADPSLFTVYKNMGNIFVRQGDFEAAEEVYNKAFVMNSGSDVLQVNLGTLDIQKKDFESALERFKQAIYLNPSNDKAWVGLALLHQTKSDHALSQASLEQALSMKPDNRTAVQLLVQSYISERKNFDAIKVVQNYLDQVNFDGEMSLLCVQLCVQNQRFDWALWELEKAQIWEPENKNWFDLEKYVRQTSK